ncbi:MAG: hypothetical protein AB7D39_20860 [Pseudodesulfovibrio sp.]|uniref:hypothetical protein n=1 Tax=Pseudodesulfovibrio sp. TaxID=2035812 RepID=UPI003D103194
MNIRHRMEIGVEMKKLVPLIIGLGVGVGLPMLILRLAPRWIANEYVGKIVAGCLTAGVLASAIAHCYVWPKKQPQDGESPQERADRMRDRVMRVCTVTPAAVGILLAPIIVFFGIDMIYSFCAMLTSLAFPLFFREKITDSTLYRLFLS